MKDTTDYLIIGAGSGGLTVALGLQKLGKKMVLISKDIGGECTHSGCVPSKTFLHLAKQIYAEHDKEKKAHLKQHLFSRIAKKIADIEQEERYLLKDIDLRIGTASFVSPHEITYTDQKGTTHHINAKHIIISAGSSPQSMDLPGIPKEHIHTNETIFSLPHLPSSITIIGAGPIGAEMATAFALCGVQVHMIIRSSFLREEPSDLSSVVKKHLIHLGVHMYEGYTFVKKSGNKLILQSKDEQEKTILASDIYLIALGRVPNLPGGIDAAGISYTEKGILINTNGTTSQRHISAIGDCTISEKYTHLANFHGRRYIQKQLFPFLPATTPTIPHVTFTDPPLASVGTMERSPLTRIFPIHFSSSDRAIIEENNDMHGLVCVHMIKGTILGASIVGDASEHLINVFTLAIQKNLTIFSFLSFIPPFPTYFSRITDLPTLFFQTWKESYKELFVSCWHIHWQKIIATSLWALIILSSWIYASSISYDLMRFLQDMSLLLQSPFGVMIFILLYCIRPLIFFSATVLSFVSGAVYGFWPGFFLTLIASNLSSIVAYTYGNILFSSGTQETFGLRAQMRSHAFVTILIARLTFLPYDLVSYIAGSVQVPLSSFLLASSIGSLVGSVAIVSFGASVSDITQYHTWRLDPLYIYMSIGAAAVSLLIRHWIQQKYRRS